MIGIYGIFRKSDNKCMYVGQSNNVEKRINEHLKYNTNTNFNETDYYGRVIETFDFYDKENQLDREAYWINELNPKTNDTRNRHLSEHHKNQVKTTLTGRTLSEEHKKNIGNSERGEKHHMFGKHWAQEIKDKISISGKGKHHWSASNETKQKMSEWQIGLVWINNGLINKRVYKAELDKYINLGWSIGMLKRK